MANTTNYNWETPDDTDLVKDGAAAIRTLGSSVDTTTKALNPSTTLGDIEYRSATANTNTRLPIGTTGQILSVVAGVPSWVANDVGDITEVQAGTGISVASGTGPIPVITNTFATTIDAKGDLIVGTGADTFARLPAGTNTYTLVADSAEATGLKWAAPAAGGGKVLQVVQGTTSTATIITATSMQDTGITCSITPTLATSKVLVLINGQVYAYKASNGATGDFQIVRNSTAVLVCDGATGYFAFGTKVGANTVESAHIISTAYLDSPATTSATTYKLQAACNQASELDWQNNSNHTSTIVLMEIGA